jgi:tetratricopeptide (TPR) repeat protein
MREPAMKWIIALFPLLLLSPLTRADITLQDLQDNWAIANYQTDDDHVEAVFTTLIKNADAAVAAHPQDADFYIWQGIIKSSYAGKVGGIGALANVKAAKVSLEKAIEIDGTALNGSAYTSLGALYYQVPGWPIAFGDNDKAREFLEKGLAINPDGIDSNYFYADFLFQQKEYRKAEEALRKAQKAAPRPGRALADESRQKEVSTLARKIEQKLQG